MDLLDIGDIGDLRAHQQIGEWVVDGEWVAAPLA